MRAARFALAVGLGLAAGWLTVAGMTAFNAANAVPAVAPW